MGDNALAPALARSSEGGATAGRERARRGVVIPIGVIVAVAIVCVVVAVLGSAQRADEVALATERQLFTRALHNQGERMLREVDAVANSEAAYRRIRLGFDIEWVQVYVGQRLQSYFDHHYVFVADGSDRLLYATSGNRRVDTNWLDTAASDLISALTELRRQGADAAAEQELSPRHLTRLQTFLGRPAILVAVAITSSESNAQNTAGNAPIVVSVKTIGDAVLAEIASHLQLHNLRQIGTEAITPGDYVFRLTDRQNQQVASFAWTPKRPGAEIVNSVIPFIAVALAGFAL
jgi:sensor domain CHASE-containing protein